MSMNFTPILPSSIEDDTVLEQKVRVALGSMCSKMKPSRSVMSTILQYAASYECVETKIGSLDLMLN